MGIFTPGPRRTHHAKAIVTGAGSGIGRAFALELAARGGEVLCADVDTDRAAETVRLIERHHGRTAHAYFCDVANRDDMESLALHAELTFGGPPTLVINNAGVGIGGKPVGDIGFEDWRWALGINLWGVVHGCEIFAPRLRAAGRGGIVNVASAAGFAAAPGMAVYNVSKAGVISLSETLAAELSGSGVAVTVLCPTFVKTNVVRDGRITAGSSRLAAELMRRTGFSPERVARNALDANDDGRLYVLPQLDARAVWLLKRQFPALYTHALGVLNRVLPQPEPAAAAAPATKTGV
ncbi:SDR family NAD(P)-dependent oxidoreductase [Nocardia sp. CDC159]|uniref:SDR family NAD(P)-dependent oxidoreductase n=1 Tax=Nocardia pulmonis TaxID=2951408 RepID=A0A9X2E1W1_9NOCA|nr:MULTISPECIES: SDR family NAD(P)-dependent oxidoreductase [Nocardia]MCM6772055.1 SDR family NAD(P)-dependent oxidoreductase [Nocardia pulmonis]MCM6785287.1 SDR family NAD(P)-dependent oxidoreductase [Nocardia sp. CDC159]